MFVKCEKVFALIENSETRFWPPFPGDQSTDTHGEETPRDQSFSSYILICPQTCLGGNSVLPGSIYSLKCIF